MTPAHLAHAVSAFSALRISIQWGRCPTCEVAVWKALIVVDGWGRICRECLDAVIGELAKYAGRKEA